MFEIQIWHRGQWQNDLASDYSKDNRFATMADAQAAMKDLIDIAIIILGGIPASDPRDSAVTYRVVEVEEPEQGHSHQWDNYLHTAYVLVRKPLEHHCKLCSDCGKLLCEVSDA
jgi:hypothetical protein